MLESVGLEATGPWDLIVKLAVSLKQHFSFVLPLKGHVRHDIWVLNSLNMVLSGWYIREKGSGGLPSRFYFNGAATWRLFGHLALVKSHLILSLFQKVYLLQIGFTLLSILINFALTMRFCLRRRNWGRNYIPLQATESIIQRKLAFI